MGTHVWTGLDPTCSIMQLYTAEVQSWSLLPFPSLCHSQTSSETRPSSDTSWAAFKASKKRTSNLMWKFWWNFFTTSSINIINSVSVLHAKQDSTLAFRCPPPSTWHANLPDLLVDTWAKLKRGRKHTESAKQRILMALYGRWSLLRF